VHDCRARERVTLQNNGTSHFAAGGSSQEVHGRKQIAASYGTRQYNTSDQSGQRTRCNSPKQANVLERIRPKKNKKNESYVDHRRQTPHEDADASKNNSSFERGDEWQHRTINNVGTFEYGKNKTRTRKQKPALSKPPNIRDVHRTKCIGITSDKQQKKGKQDTLRSANLSYNKLQFWSAAKTWRARKNAKQVQRRSPGFTNKNARRSVERSDWTARGGHR